MARVTGKKGKSGSLNAGQAIDDWVVPALTAEQWEAMPVETRAELISGLDDLTLVVVAWLEAEGAVVEESDPPDPDDRVYSIKRRYQA